MTPSPCLLVIPQRHGADCAVAALAMLLNMSYEDVLLAAPWPTMRSGMTARQLMATARRLGFELVAKRDFDMDEDTGLLWVQARRWNHLVMLKAGLVFDTDASVWEADVYFAASRTKPRVLYTLK